MRTGGVQQTMRTGRQLCALLLAAVSTLSLAAAGDSSASPTLALVFERNGDLFAVTIDGSRTIRLTRTRADEEDPAVAPDGRSIAFVRGVDPTQQIWTMRPGGLAHHIPTRGDDSMPSWAPDGKTIYFVRTVTARHGPDCGEIFRMSSAGKKVTRVTQTATTGHSHADPAVSPDGRRVAFSDWNACEGGTAGPRLRVVDTRGRPTRDLARLRHNGYWAPERSGPAWSPDGKRLAFHRNSDLMVARRDGSGERLVVRGDGYLTYVHPVWSPDGRWIVFMRGVDVGTARIAALFIVRPDGSGLRRLARPGDSPGGWLRTLPR